MISVLAMYSLTPTLLSTPNEMLFLWEFRLTAGDKGIPGKAKVLRSSPRLF